MYVIYIYIYYSYTFSLVYLLCRLADDVQHPDSILVFTKSSSFFTWKGAFTSYEWFFGNPLLIAFVRFSLGIQKVELVVVFCLLPCELGAIEAVLKHFHRWTEHVFRTRSYAQGHAWAFPGKPVIASTFFSLHVQNTVFLKLGLRTSRSYAAVIHDVPAYLFRRGMPALVFVFCRIDVWNYFYT